jgi:hypothetical protein
MGRCMTVLLLLVLFLFDFQLAMSVYAAAPSVTTRPATGVLENSAYLNADINPNGRATHYAIYYDRVNLDKGPPSITHTSHADSTLACVGDLRFDDRLQELSCALHDLAASTEYSFTPMGYNADGVSFGKQLTFRTLAGPCKGCGSPEIKVSYPIVGSNYATLVASINPKGATTRYTAYLHRTYPTTSGTVNPCGTRELPASMEWTTVSCTIYGLTPSATYEYLFEASNDLGNPVQSDTLTFTTTS